MSENILKEIMLEVHRIECRVPNDLPDYKPSLRHRLAMKRVFARFARNTCKLRNAGTIQEPPITDYSTRRYNIKHRILTAMLIIILMTLLVGCVNAIVRFVSEHFNGTVYEDNTKLSAANLENCSQTIEYQYALTNIPEGFELIEIVSTPSYVYMNYRNMQNGQEIIFWQWVKTHFSPHYNTEKNIFEEIKINGTTGLFIDLKGDKLNKSVFI